MSRSTSRNDTCTSPLLLLLLTATPYSYSCLPSPPSPRHHYQRDIVVFSDDQVKVETFPVDSILSACVLYWNDNVTEDKIAEVEQGG